MESTLLFFQIVGLMLIYRIIVSFEQKKFQRGVIYFMILFIYSFILLILFIK